MGDGALIFDNLRNGSKGVMGKARMGRGRRAGGRRSEMPVFPLISGCLRLFPLILQGGRGQAGAWSQGGEED